MMTMNKIILFLCFLSFSFSQTLENKLLGHWDSPENQYYKQVEELTAEAAEFVYQKIPSNIKLFKNGKANFYFFDSKELTGNWKVVTSENKDQGTLTINFDDDSSQSYNIYYFDKEVFPLLIERQKKMPNANKDLLKIIEKDFKGDYPGMFLKPANGRALLFQRIKKFE